MSRNFFSKNIVMVVMVPVMVAAHYGWLQLQTVDNLVSADDRNKLPSPITKILNKE